MAPCKSEQKTVSSIFVEVQGKHSLLDSPCSTLGLEKQRLFELGSEAVLPKQTNSSDFCVFPTLQTLYEAILLFFSTSLQSWHHDS